MMNPIISPGELVILKQEKEKPIKLVDARSGPDARGRYEELQLQGALWVDLEQDLADIKDDLSQGGRHPLPEPEHFSGLLGRLGITPESHVVVYDDKGGAFAAARFWWMMNAAGHEQIQVLDGGLDAGLKAGFPAGSGPETVASVEPYPFKAWQLKTVSMQEVAATATDPEFLVIDVREEERFRGEAEPIDLIAGHIPGAVNLPYTNNLDPEGYYLPHETLGRMYTEIAGNYDPSKVIVHCGSGVTACHTILAMAKAGMKIPALYTGSWSEWSRNDRTIATGK